MSCGCGGAERCGCCEGTDTVTPREVFNRPGLHAIRWRVGEHADFLETMRSRIGRVWVDVETGELGAHGRARKARLFPLRALRTRAPDDPTLALLDCWALVADVLSFYTDRIAAEGYLRTATELRSVNELARLVGYRRRPGVAASVYLAFVADETWLEPLVVPEGARVQSLPEPGEEVVFFETDAALTAHADWNVLAPRVARPSLVPSDRAASVAALHLGGTATRLAPNDALLLSYGDDAGDQRLRRVASVHEDFEAQRTMVALGGGDELPPPAEPVVVDSDVLIRELERPPSVPPATPARLALTAEQAFGPGSTAVDALLNVFHPDAADGFARARANATVVDPPALRSVSALRVKAFVFGNDAPPKVDTSGPVIAVATSAAGDWDLAYPDVVPPDGETAGTYRTRVLDLDTTYDEILPETFIAVERSATEDVEGLQLITRVQTVETATRVDYGMSRTVTRLVLDDPWLPEQERLLLAPIRSTTVRAAPEALEVVDEPVDGPVCGAEIELDRQADGLQPGRWLVVTGERAMSAGEAGGDAFSATGVPASELTMLAAVRQDTLWVDGGDVVPRSRLTGDSKPVPLPGDRIHTFLELATPLAYCYKRDTVKIHANVAHATHGETHEEPLGSGDAATPFQTFALKTAPLTYVSAATTSGVESTLRVYVNDVRWQEAENLLDLGPADRGHLTSADQEEKTSVIFGDGRNGARLPNGVENVRAVYRSGIGKGGNVRADQLSQLVTHTEGLRGVTNPQRASGGADPEGAASARARAPLAVAALDRLVATRDYADFAQLFAGVGKASAARLASARGRLVHVTVAGEDDIPIDPGSDLQRNLVAALRRFGDPHLPVQVSHRELLALVIGAGVRIEPDCLWEVVRPQLEAALLDRFGFARRRLAEDAYAADALATMQGVPGVDYVDLDQFAAIPQSTSAAALADLGTTVSGALRQRIPALPDRSAPGILAPLPAQLILLTGPATLLLSEIPDE